MEATHLLSAQFCKYFNKIKVATVAMACMLDPCECPLTAGASWLLQVSPAAGTFAGLGRPTFFWFLVKDALEYVFRGSSSSALIASRGVRLAVSALLFVELQRRHFLKSVESIEFRLIMVVFAVVPFVGRHDLSPQIEHVSCEAIAFTFGKSIVRVAETAPWQYKSSPPFVGDHDVGNRAFRAKLANGNGKKSQSHILWKLRYLKVTNPSTKARR